MEIVDSHKTLVKWVGIIAGAITVVFGYVSQQGAFEQHIKDYELVTSAAIEQLHKDMEDQSAETVRLQIRVAELNTHYKHIEDKLNSMEAKIDRLLSNQQRR